MRSAFIKTNHLMRLFKHKLSDKSIATLEQFSEAIELNGEVSDVLAALHQARLISYATKRGMADRFGTRVKKSDQLSLTMQVINGMAFEIERLQAELAYHKTKDKPQS